MDHVATAPPRRRTKVFTILGSLLALSCSACDTTPVVKSEATGDGAAKVAEVTVETLAKAGYEVASSPGGNCTAAWRPVAKAVPVNELFEIEVLLFEGRGVTQPLTGAKLQASAWMPEHMHGMSRRPQAVETAPGRYLVRGLLLHMEGFWQLFFDVVAGKVSERIEFAITLK